MIELRPLDNVVRIQPQVKILLPGWWLKFSDQFPAPLEHVRGKTFKVSKNVQVRYSLSYILKEACYKDVEFSNEDSGNKLYPYDTLDLYELIIGFSPGQYYAIPYFPADQPLYRLGYPTMTPVMSDSDLKYLGRIDPEDSPTSNATFKIYTLYKLKPLYLRLIADDGVAYEKCTLELLVNRCKLEEGKPPEGVQPKPIEYLDSLKW